MATIIRKKLLPIFVVLAVVLAIPLLALAQEPGLTVIENNVTPRTVAFEGNTTPGYLTVVVKTNIPSRGSVKVYGNSRTASINLSSVDYKTEHLVNWVPYDNNKKEPLPPGEYTLKLELQDKNLNSITGYPMGTITVVAEPNPKKLIEGITANPAKVAPKYDNNGVVTTVSYQLSRHAEVQMVVQKDGVEYYNGPKQKLAPGQHQITWNGRNNNGVIVPDGEYQLAFKTVELNYSYPEQPKVTAIGSITVAGGEHELPNWVLNEYVSAAGFEDAVVTPNDDGIKDTVDGTLTMNKRATVAVWVVNAVGAHVKNVVEEQYLDAGVHNFNWDTKDFMGSSSPNGVYTLKVMVKEENGAWGYLNIADSKVTVQESYDITVPEPVQKVRVLNDNTQMTVTPYIQGYKANKGDIFPVIRYESTASSYEVLVAQGVVGRIKGTDVEMVGDLQPDNGTIMYTVASGDTLWKIAKQYHTTVDAIVKANNLDVSNHLMVGQQLIIPTTVDVVSPPEQPVTPPPAQQPGDEQQKQTVYVVQSGDTLWKIAQQYRTTVDAIVKANSLDVNKHLVVGQQLVVPTTADVVAPPEKPVTPPPAQQPGDELQETVYIVRSGDSLWKIAQQHKTTVDAIIKTNNLDPSKHLTIGQKLTIANNSSVPIPAPVQPMFYNVQAGDSLWKIAVKHNTTVDSLVKLNNLNINNSIYVGQQIRIS